MTGPLAYVDGAFVPQDAPAISIFDRGFLFGDGVYEVIAVYDGRLIDARAHLDRLARSLRELHMGPPAEVAELEGICRSLVCKNGTVEGTVYLQITRGVAPRHFEFPKACRPTVVVFTQAKRLVDRDSVASGVRVVTVPDLRWKRRDIKSVALLAQVLAKQAAVAAGGQEAWMIEDGLVTEGGSSTAFIVDHDNTLITRPLNHEVLPGITRRAVTALLDRTDLTLVERAFTVDEAVRAQEAFVTGASMFVTPVVRIDTHTVGDGTPGTYSRLLLDLYLSEVARS